MKADSSTRRKKIEAGVLKVIEHVMKPDETSTKAEKP